jgi:hypothetical protein
MAKPPATQLKITAVMNTPGRTTTVGRWGFCSGSVTVTDANLARLR